jgi:hypothetical protein
MLKKWYIVAFILVVTLLGVNSQQQIVVPNQEIVLQFTDSAVTSDDIENTIATVKKQLQAIGANNIQVKKAENGKLKITYFTDVDLAGIKKSFSDDGDLDINFKTHNTGHDSDEFPSDENNIAYNLNVYEIQNGQDADWDLNGISVKNIDSKSDRFSDPNSNFFLNNESPSKEDNLEKITYKVRTNIALAIDDILYKIPEVRAGPIC